jgi:hypothetical protein
VAHAQISDAPDPEAGKVSTAPPKKQRMAQPETDEDAAPAPAAAGAADAAAEASPAKKAAKKGKRGAKKQAHGKAGLPQPPNLSRLRDFPPLQTP